MITNEALRKMAKAYLDNGDFNVSGYARIEKAGAEYIASDGDFAQEFIDGFVKSGEDWDGLSTMAYNLAINLNLLTASEMFVFDTLDMSDHEQWLRYQAEMNEDEQKLFILCHQAMFGGNLPEWYKK